MAKYLPQDHGKSKKSAEMEAARNAIINNKL